MRQWKIMIKENEYVHVTFTMQKGTWLPVIWCSVKKSIQGGKLKIYFINGNKLSNYKIIIKPIWTELEL